jgi:hypothetical protein
MCTAAVVASKKGCKCPDTLRTKKLPYLLDSGQCCGAENISFGSYSSGSAEPQIRRIQLRIIFEHTLNITFSDMISSTFFNIGLMHVLS